MGRETNIEWCDSTINGSSGCDGCELWSGTVKTCYAGNLQEARLSKSMPSLYSQDFKDVRMIPLRYAQAAAWSDLRGTERPEKPWLNGMPRCIFVGDMGDTFSRAVTDEYLTRELLGAMTSKAGKRHFWMLLTKRPARLAQLATKWGGLPDNAMAMTTVTDQRTADVRVPQLLQVPCKWRGLSCEPLLGPVDLRVKADGSRLNALYAADSIAPSAIIDHEPRVHWVIAGGESGTTARPMHPKWASSLMGQCAAAHVPFFFKQHGSWVTQYAEMPKPVETTILWPDGDRMKEEEFVQFAVERGGRKLSWGVHAMSRFSKEVTGRLLEGTEHNGFPVIG